MEKKKITEGLAEITANSAKKVKEVATDLSNKVAGFSKENTTAIHKDIDTLVDWISQHNDILQQENVVVEQTRFEDLPVLGKVIFGGETAINELPDEERNRYAEYFKKNGARITVLTAVNPLFGLGTLGAEAAASDLISQKTAIGTAATGAGMIGASMAASTLAPVSYFAWSALKVAVPALRIAGLGVLAIGAGATLFKSIERLPQGQKIIEVFDKTQSLHNDCYFQLENNINRMGNILSQKIKETAEKLETTTKKIAITIDDAVHSDQNLRLMQYHEIILELYKNQSEIKETLSNLVAEYNALKIENEKLNIKIANYQSYLQALACGSEYV